MSEAASQAISKAPESTAEAFEQICQTHLPMFRRVATRYLRFADEAEEAVQEGFLRAWRYRDRFRGDCALASWVGTIIIRQCQDRIRRKRCRISSLEVPLEGPDPAAPDATLETLLRSEQRRLVIELTPQLTHGQRDFICRVLAGEHLDMTLSRNKMARHHAVQRLQGILRSTYAVA